MEKWKILGEDYENQFGKYSMGQMFCPAETEKITIKGSFCMKKYSFVLI